VRAAFAAALAQALTEAGLPALFQESATLSSLTRAHGGPSLDPMKIVWDVDYVDPGVFPRGDSRDVVVVRLSGQAQEAKLVRRIVELIRMLRDQGSPPDVIVLEPPDGVFRPRSFERKRKSA